jgi:general stress protein YciG
VDWKQMVDRAKRELDKRGGPPSAKEDAEELRDIARGGGSMSDKLKRAAAALKEPGAHKPGSEPAAGPAPGAPAADPPPGAPETPPASGSSA